MHSYTHITRSFLPAFALLVASLILVVPHAHAIGISPPIIEAKNVLRNSAQSHSVTLLVEGPATDDIYFDVMPRGQYGHYIKGASEFIIPKGQSSATYTFDIEPEDAAVAAYELQLAFTEKPKPTVTEDGAPSSGTGAKVSVLQGAILVIRMTVSGDEIVGFELQRASFEDTETRLPLVGTYTVYNTGNVEWKPERIDVVVTDVNDPENAETYTIKNEDIPLVKPGKTVDAKMNIAHTLVEGKYTAHLKFYYKGAQVSELVSPAFNVFTIGTLNQAGELVSVSTNKERYVIGEQIVLKGLFKNTGDVTVQGQLETNIYKDGTFVNLEVSRTLNIDRRQETEFQQFLKLNEPGVYTLEVAATYGNRKTPTQTLTVTIESAPIGQVTSTFISIALVILLVIAILAFLFWFVRHQKKKATAVSMQPQMPIASVAPVATPTPVAAPPTAAPEASPAPVPSPETTPAVIIPEQTPVDASPAAPPANEGVAPVNTANPS